VSHEVLATALASSRELAVLGPAPGVVVARSALVRLGEAALTALGGFHREQPLRAAMPREELRERVFSGLRPAVFERVVADLAGAGRVRLSPDAVALARHEVRLSAGEEEARRLLTAAAAASGLAGVELAVVAEQAGQDLRLLERVAAVLVSGRILDRVGDDLLVLHERLETLKRTVRESWPAGSKLEVSAFKQLTGLSRKYVIPLLEYLDRERVTRRAGSDRIVL
jgi:selenocysteine-specific elongation factor